jgi:predicted peptidase
MRFIAKPVLIGICLCLVVGSCKKQDITVQEPERPSVVPQGPKITMQQRAVTAPVGNAVLGYYVGIPSNYNQTTGRYPLLLFLPGAGQLGNGASDLPLLLFDGVAQLLDEGKFPSVFKVNGKEFTFIVMTPQFRWWPSTPSIEACIDYARRTYRIDSTRIYLAGLSMGGILTCDLGAEKPMGLAAIVPMAGVSRDYDVRAKSRQIAQGNLPVWAFHSANDPVTNVNSVRSFITDINSFNPLVPAKLTVWASSSHDAWTKALDPAYKEGGMSIYEWMLQYHR